jgi:hypothetical protein
MPTKLFTAIVLTAAFGAAACTGDDDLVAPTPTPNPVTETFTGSLTVNGADTHPFSVTTSGTVRATITRLEPETTALVGFSLGTWNGATCQTIISNDSATQGTSVVGTADREGRLCVRIYDAAGTLPAAQDYEITVVRP